MARAPWVPVIAVLRRNLWFAVLVIGLPCMAAGLWGYYGEDPGYQTAIEAVAYFWVPLLLFVVVELSVIRLAWRARAVFVAIVLLDVEAGLLGSGQLMALPFVVAIPLIGVAIGARVLPNSRARFPYVAAWVGGSAGVTNAALRTLDPTAFSALIPAFAVVDALALFALWHLDSGRLKAIDSSAEAESRVRDLFEGVDLFGVHTDRESRIDFINEFALKVTGWKRDEVIGADWWDTFVPPDRRQDGRARWPLGISGEIPRERQRESTIITKVPG